MRAVSLMTIALLAGTPALAEGPSVVCSVEFTRRLAIMSSNYTDPRPAWRYWVHHGGTTVGPWTLLDIKREMVLGRLPHGFHFQAVEAPEGWLWSLDVNEFQPLPGPSALGPDELAGGLSSMLSGCWVSDPFAERPGTQTVWILFLMNDGVLIATRGVRRLDTGAEEFAILRSSNEQWSAAGRGGADITLRLPDIEVLHPHDDFAARVIDRNTLVIVLPGTAGVTFRRL